MATVPLPIAIVTAVVNHGLYDLRHATNRALVWLILSAGLVATYAAVVAICAVLFPQHSGVWVPALAAAAVALVLVAARDALQRRVNRAIYGRQREPYDTELGTLLAGAADIDRGLDATVIELERELDLHNVAVRDVEGRVVSGAPAAGGRQQTIRLFAYANLVGELTFRTPGPTLSTAEDRLVRDLARQLGMALHAKALRDDLQLARERIVFAREEERRRLRRDLHDGIAPSLAALKLKAETARRLLPPGSGAAAERLQEVSAEIRETVTDIRRLVEGLRPPALDELGLGAACLKAVHQLTEDSGIAIVMEGFDRLPPLPAAIEVAAYRIILEAVTNVIRHAHASSCLIAAGAEAESLRLEVTDDGRGMNSSSGQGHGLLTMAERVAELGGDLQLEPSPGFTVRARLPLGAPFTAVTDPIAEEK